MFGAFWSRGAAASETAADQIFSAAKTTHKTPEYRDSDQRTDYDGYYDWPPIGKVELLALLRKTVILRTGKTCYVLIAILEQLNILAITLGHTAIP
jgi:hypothetical protein